ncbi:hypothetical protein OSB04_000861 [Centaurea solstitialis]|uniref:Uncharacterized protein n=1 Tax=Centaurea solstitialis TaxID=347529 RepID=A0AA38U1N6_9ASTR|nr:hypothetical protein OSB04_000861 [Centaurea solstitialis]
MWREIEWLRKFVEDIPKWPKPVTQVLSGSSLTASAVVPWEQTANLLKGIRKCKIMLEFNNYVVETLLHMTSWDAAFRNTVKNMYNQKELAQKGVFEDSTFGHFYRFVILWFKNRFKY